MTDEGKAQIFKERRESKAKEVKIVFIDAENNFNVIDTEGTLKYVGIIYTKDPHLQDYCTCQSFYHGNSEDYQREHGVSFNCKHIIAAKLQRFTNHPEPQINPIANNSEQKMIQTDLLL